MRLAVEVGSAGWRGRTQSARAAAGLCTGVRLAAGPGPRAVEVGVLAALGGLRLRLAPLLFGASRSAEERVSAVAERGS